MKKVLVLLAEGFEEVEALTVVDYLKRKDVLCETCSITGEKMVVGAHKIRVEADKVLAEIKNIDNYQALIIPGGLPGATNLRDNPIVIRLVQAFNHEEKILAAICAGPIVLEKAGVLKEKKVTSYPGFEGELKESTYLEDIVVQDGNIITARGPAVAVYFVLKILENLAGKEKSNELKKDILLDMVEEKVGQ
ncbi:DJ-1 family glyoxalase III [Sporanaerobacter acetigenes]|uniref:4-methyl-5(B-hydroxyethyl)-thiazole monophosphate biosynthesis n=1 Tax=Sporanaerobacter acetigenes DSM 13106 TaxID=1123281 RepID=A0A1M5YXM5_9FIRM|nr:DJ-1 family glyoxalase III [Sporanaerobacter acetigenes]SHI16799.1 4-methyl-5(b-hydroxyethyl)-thiazole monophosphate biosynthesis [Sporanaerobacter acetigenes DSM 13106]